jgi:hypothetical protein
MKEDSLLQNFLIKLEVYGLQTRYGINFLYKM